MKVATKADAIMAIKEMGLFKISQFLQLDMVTYFLMRWGIRRRPGIIKNAGNVMRLNTPKTTTSASMEEVKTEERFCYMMLDSLD